MSILNNLEESLVNKIKVINDEYISLEEKYDQLRDDYKTVMVDIGEAGELLRSEGYIVNNNKWIKEADGPFKS